MDALTKVLAVEWGPYKVRVNGIVPGAIAGTEGFERLGNLSNMNNRKATDSSFAAKASSTEMPNVMDFAPVPIARFGEVEDIANAALYLSSGASAYVSGWNMVVDGGSWLTMPNMMFGNSEFVKKWASAKL